MSKAWRAPSQKPFEMARRVLAIAIEVAAASPKQSASHLLSVDRWTHDALRQALRLQRRPARIIEASLKEVLRSTPNPKLFRQFQLALQRWWPLNGGQEIRLASTNLYEPEANADVLEATSDFCLRKNPHQELCSYILTGMHRWTKMASDEYFPLLLDSPAYAFVVCRIFFSHCREDDVVVVGTYSMDWHTQLATTILCITGREYSIRSGFSFTGCSPKPSLIKLEHMQELRNSAEAVVNWMDGERSPRPQSPPSLPIECEEVTRTLLRLQEEEEEEVDDQV